MANRVYWQSIPATLREAFLDKDLQLAKIGRGDDTEQSSCQGVNGTEMERKPYHIPLQSTATPLLMAQLFPYQDLAQDLFH